MPRPLRSGALVPRGDFVESDTIGSIVVIKTTAQVYLVHTDWIPEVDPITAARIRAHFASSALSFYELAAMYGVSQPTIERCVKGQHAFRDLPRVQRQLEAGA